MKVVEMFLKAFLILTFFSGCIVQALIDYCDPSLCPPPQFNNHTACRNTGMFNQINCPKDIKIRKLTKEEKQFILDLHNGYRALVASGFQQTSPNSTTTFPAASRMMKLTWDEEQAFLASLHLKTCLSHDSCHNTAFNSTTGRLIFSGQNIFWFWQFGARYPFQKYLDLATFLWFNEYQYTPLNSIDSLYFPPGTVIGHFTQMIHDKNYAVGCAAAEWTEKLGQQSVTQITCNYVKAHYSKRPVYDKGAACSMCKVCDDNEFQTLCLS